AIEEFKGRSLEIWNSIDWSAIPPDLQQRLRDAFEGIFDKLGSGDDDPGGFGKAARNLQELIRAGRGLTSLARQLGKISDSTEHFVDGLLDALDSLSALATSFDEVHNRAMKFSDLTSGAFWQNAFSLENIGSTIGLASGVMSAVVGIVGAFTSAADRRREAEEKQRREMEELRKALRENARSIPHSIKQLIETTRPGGGLTGSKRDALQRESRNLERFVEGQQEAHSPLGGGVDRNAFFSYLDRLEAIGIDELDHDFIEDIKEIYDALIATGVRPEDAMAAILDGTAPGMSLGLSELFETLLGDFGSIVDGAIARYRSMLNLLEMEIPDAFGSFVQYLLDNIDSLSSGAQSLLDEALGITSDGEITPEERERLKEIGRIFAQAAIDGNTGFLGGMSAEDAERIAQMFLDAANGVEPTEEDGFTRSVQYLRQITLAQGEEMVLLLREVSYYMRQLYLLHRSVYRP